MSTGTVSQDSSGSTLKNLQTNTEKCCLATRGVRLDWALSECSLLWVEALPQEVALLCPTVSSIIMALHQK